MLYLRQHPKDQRSTPSVKLVLVSKAAGSCPDKQQRSSYTVGLKFSNLLTSPQGLLQRIFTYFTFALAKSSLYSRVWAASTRSLERTSRALVHMDVQCRMHACMRMEQSYTVARAHTSLASQHTYSKNGGLKAVRSVTQNEYVRNFDAWRNGSLNLVIT